MKRKIIHLALYSILPITTFFIGIKLQPNQNSQALNESKKLEADKSSPKSEISHLTNKASQDESKLSKATTDQTNPLSLEPLDKPSLDSSEIKSIGQSMVSELNPLKRREIFNSLLEGMTLENAQEIREQIKKLNQYSSEFRDFHFIWGSMAGAEAVINGTKTSERDLDITMTGWVSSKPDEAIAWFDKIDTLNDKRLSKNVLKRSVVDGLSNIDPNRAADFVSILAQSGDKDANKLIKNVGYKVTQIMDLEKAGAWADGLTNKNLRKSAMESIVPKFAYSDPESASKWAESLQSDMASTAINKVGEIWSNKDPAASVKWLESLPESKGTNSGIENALSNWARRDPKSASDHLVGMPDSMQKDRAIKGFASRVAYEDPQSALVWANTIQDEKIREGALRDAGRAYYKRDKTGALQWLETSGLPPKTINEILPKK